MIISLQQVRQQQVRQQQVRRQAQQPPPVLTDESVQQMQ
jgi:hypothetical protein